MKRGLTDVEVFVSVVSDLSIFRGYAGPIWIVNSMKTFVAILKGFGLYILSNVFGVHARESWKAQC